MHSDASDERRPTSQDERTRTRTNSRSPHPYHRRGRSLITGKALDRQFLTPPQDTSSSHTILTSSSESGTEADDEAGQTLKRLPAPPLKLSKGFRGSKYDLSVDPSPLPTPSESYVDRRLHLRAEPDTLAVASGLEAREDISKRRIREKYTKRKQAEVIRRVTELCLLTTVGGFICVRPEVREKLADWKQELYTFGAIPAALYFSYPLRLLWRAPTPKTHHPAPSASTIRIPSSFDPAPLLYPVFLPFFVATSLLEASTTFLLPNMILGLSSIPSSCIPLFEATFSYSCVQWMLTTIPLMSSQNSFTAGHPARPLALKVPVDGGINPELLVLLYPLHASLVPTLRYLTTTSLDPAELELLSTILLNLLLFARSPQMEILKSILWIGGIGLFCLCSKVLAWEVALARLPLWKLRRNEGKQDSRRSLLESWDAMLCDRLTKSTTRTGEDDSSDDNIDGFVTEQSMPIKSLRPSMTLDVNGAIPDTQAAKLQRISSTAEPNPQYHVAPDREKESFASKFSRARRHTFNTVSESMTAAKSRTTPNRRPKRAVATNSQPFLFLTPAQAQMRKWLYAMYTYCMTILLILVPIRRYVETKALGNHDPFGWAIGYLGGNIPALRFWTVSNNLDRWICLPERPELEMENLDSTGWMDCLRHRVGSAQTRIFLCAYCLCVLVSGLGAVLRLSSVAEVDTRRKVFHGVMVAMFLPTIYIDPCFAALALGLILSIFLLLDLFRASQLPPISKPLTYFLAPYVDGRDHRGPVIVSHIFLLIGCAIPLWLSLAGAKRIGLDPWTGWDLQDRDVSMVSGVICVGLGDAAASLIGRRFGRHKWCWAGGKSLEGSMAFILAVMSGLMASYAWLVLGGWNHHRQSWRAVLIKSSVAASGASLTEAVLTGANDNVVVPVVLWLLVRGLGI